MNSRRRGTRVFGWRAGVTDMRKGFDSLRRRRQTVLGQDPFSGHVFWAFAAGAAIWSSCCGGCGRLCLFPPKPGLGGPIRVAAAEEGVVV